MGPTDHPVPGNQKEVAEQEQQYYIQKLFHRYGQQDRLDFRGFQNLLLSLGLGKVRVVGLDHDNLGHDHVAHLELLEVQEGQHSHSAGHPHSHPKHSHDNHHHDSHVEPDGHSCSPSFTAVAKPTAESKPRGRKDKDGERDHDHDHDHHVHDHKPEHGNTRTQSVYHDHTHNNHDHDNTQTKTPDHDHTQDSLEHSHDHTKQHTNEHMQETNDLAGPSLDSTLPSSHEDKTHRHGHHHHKHPHPHHYHHAPDTTDQMKTTQTTLASLQLSNPEALALQPSSQPPTSTPTWIRRQQKGKGQRGQSRTPNPTISYVVDDSGNDYEHDHNHDHHLHHQGKSSKEKRAVPGEMMNPNSSLADWFKEMPHQHEEVAHVIIIANS